MYRLGTLGRDQRRDLLAEVERRRVDLSRCERPDWFIQPLSALGLAQHPDRERIRATIEVVAAHLVALAIDAVIAEDADVFRR
jgi:hypothetical protein